MRTLTLQLSVKVDYPVDLDLKSLDGNVSQRSLTAVAQENTYSQCPFGGFVPHLTSVIDINPDAVCS